MGLSSYKIIGFLAITDAARSRQFYENVLGLRFLEDDGFALAMEANGNMIRLAKMETVTPARYTVLGWEVPDIAQRVNELAALGVTFHQYGMPGQNEHGIWASPSGAKVAWFSDPDGNVLSVSQHPGRASAQSAQE